MPRFFFRCAAERAAFLLENTIAMFCKFRLCSCFLLLVFACSAVAGIFATVRGIVHDAQHRPIAGAHLSLLAKQSDWKRETTSDDEGKFQIDAVPAGAYTLRISH